MRPSLQLKIGQQLTMTPQLQQSIRLLQLSSVDLQQEIIEQLYSNPLLEMDEDNDHGQAPAKERDSSETPLSEESLNKDILEELPVDAKWDDLMSVQPTLSGQSEEFDFDRVQAVTESLRDHLLWQLNLTQLSPIDRSIGEFIIDSLDDRGFLTTSIDELEPVFAAADIDRDEIVAVLKRIQQFDPPGIAARSLQECLQIQLNQLPPGTTAVATAQYLVKFLLEKLSRLSFAELARKARTSEEEITQAIALIRSLNPSPGESVSSSDVDYVIPDVCVKKHNGRWQVELTRSMVTKLRINQHYSSMIQRGEGDSDNQFLKQNLQEAKWFLRSLESRNETLLRVSSAIVEMQQAFLESGPVAMRPMVLNDIAEKLELHESTISRVTTQKFMDTPQGIFELKYFFSSHLSTAAGGECSSTAVCAMLKSMIDKENPAKPLSDSKLMQLLQDEGIQVARRTVAKYRESMGIASSSQRKRL